MFYDFSSRAGFHICFLNLGTFETQQDLCEIRTQGLSSLFLQVCFPNAQAYPASPLGITSLMTFFFRILKSSGYLGNTYPIVPVRYPGLVKWNKKARGLKIKTDHWCFCLFDPYLSLCWQLGLLLSSGEDSWIFKEASLWRGDICRQFLILYFYILPKSWLIRTYKLSVLTPLHPKVRDNTKSRVVENWMVNLNEPDQCSSVLQVGIGQNIQARGKNSELSFCYFVTWIHYSHLFLTYFLCCLKVRW